MIIKVEPQFWTEASQNSVLEGEEMAIQQLYPLKYLLVKSWSPT